MFHKTLTLIYFNFHTSHFPQYGAFALAQFRV